MSPSKIVTLLPTTTAVPSVAVVLSVTRTVGVVSFVMLSEFDLPVSERVVSAKVGASGAVLSSAIDCAVATAARFSAEVILEIVDAILLASTVVSNVDISAVIVSEFVRSIVEEF